MKSRIFTALPGGFFMATPVVAEPGDDCVIQYEMVPVAAIGMLSGGKIPGAASREELGT